MPSGSSLATAPCGVSLINGPCAASIIDRAIFECIHAIYRPITSYARTPPCDLELHGEVANRFANTRGHVGIRRHVHERGPVACHPRANVGFAVDQEAASAGRPMPATPNSSISSTLRKADSCMQEPSGQAAAGASEAAYSPPRLHAARACEAPVLKRLLEARGLFGRPMFKWFSDDDTARMDTLTVAVLLVSLCAVFSSCAHQGKDLHMQACALPLVISPASWVPVT